MYPPKPFRKTQTQRHVPLLNNRYHPLNAIRLTTLLLTTCMLSGWVSAADDHCKRYHTAIWDNDAIAFDDAGYSHSFAYAWGYAKPECATNWAQTVNHWMTGVSSWQGLSSGYKTTLGYKIAHEIYTPTDIQDAELIEDDRPYTGLMYGTLYMQHYTIDSATRYEFLAGAVGPMTGSEAIQNMVHTIIGAQNPNGWDNQIGNEIVLRAALEKSWRVYSSDNLISGYETDTIILADAKLGNLNSDIGTGVSFRIGRGLAQSYPEHWLTPGYGLFSTHLKPGDWGVFATLYGSYVFNDITIEGNTFNDSHGVPLIHVQGRYVIGGYYQINQFGFATSIQESTDMFKNSDENTLYMTLSFSY
ncbi:MAG: lipid A deacylase LpxR family protein [Hahellaceae bacterium]|nr:lipid A deacylase LpxR family protein [Hahellaceae bacterium]MCP5210439.1 lipid A deacylase LpxR family protein [Hahellaceae bacterium]